MRNFWLYVVRILSLCLFLFVMFRNIPVIWIALYGITLIAALFFGRFFCGWICPINTCLVSTDKIVKKLKLPQRKAPRWLSSGWLSWILFLAFVAFVIVTQIQGNENLPIPLYFAGVAIILTFFFLPEVFHNTICPFGVMQKLLGRSPLFSKRVDSTKCVGCKMCISVCPTDAITLDSNKNKAVIDKQYCHQCNTCQEVCPSEAITYRTKSKETTS